MTMQRRHYEAIAAVIRELTLEPNAVSAAQRDAIAHRFANALAGTNARFARERFLRACGVEDSE